MADPTAYYVQIEGTNLAGYHRETIESPDNRQIQLEAWPGDTPWLSAVRTEASSSISTLEDLIGTGLPGNGPITVREVAGGSLGDAYAGVYDPEEHLAQIPEDYQQAGTVAHELSHAWFNGSLFASQWMSEGYASWAERAVGANPEACVAPRGSVTDPMPVLSDWKIANPRATKAELDAVSAEYDASCALISNVAAAIGPQGMRDVLAVLLSSEGAYPGTHDTQIGAPVDWRAWLDAVDERGMVPAGKDSTAEIAGLVTTYGVASQGDLAGRAEARDPLGELRTRAHYRPEWAIPQAVYGPLATWDYPTAQRAMTEMTAVMDDGLTLEMTLQISPTDGPLPTRLAAAANLADLTAVHEAADRQVAVAEDVAAAIDRASADHGPLDAIGLIGVDFRPTTKAAVASVAGLDLDQARASVAAIDATLTGATAAGLLRLGLAIALVALVLFGRLVRPASAPSCGRRGHRPVGPGRPGGPGRPRHSGCHRRADPALPGTRDAGSALGRPDPGRRMKDRAVATAAVVAAAVAVVVISAGVLLGTSRPATVPSAPLVASSPHTTAIAASDSPSPDAPPSASAVASPSASPESSASTDSMVTVALMTGSCSVDDAGGVAHKKVVRTERIRLPASVSDRLLLFAIDDWRVLAPKDWSCFGSFGTNGTMALTIAALNVAPAADGSLPAVVVESKAASYLEVVETACPFFADAARRVKVEYFSPCRKSPAGEAITRVDAKRVIFVDDAGVKGAGAGSGGALPVAGAVLLQRWQAPDGREDQLQHAIGGRPPLHDDRR